MKGALVSEETQAVVAVGANVLPMPRRTAAAKPAVADEQLAYATLLERGVKVGFLGIVATFGIYLTGALAPRIPVTELPRYWSLPVHQYLAATGTRPGWAWLQLLGHGDYLNFLGIAFLSGITVVCYLALVPVFLRKKDTVYAWLAVLEVLVLVLAASGILNAGAH